MKSFVYVALQCCVEIFRSEGFRIFLRYADFFTIQRINIYLYHYQMIVIFDTIVDRCEHKYLYEIASSFKTQNWTRRNNERCKDGPNARGDVGQRFVEYLYYGQEEQDRTEQVRQVSCCVSLVGDIIRGDVEISILKVVI